MIRPKSNNRDMRDQIDYLKTKARKISSSKDRKNIKTV
jgi:hypothetical protein